MHQGTSAAGSPNGDDTSSSSDNSQNEDADTEMKDKREEVKLDKELQSTSQRKQHEEKEKLLETSKENTLAETSLVDGKSVTEKLEEVQMAEAGDATEDVPNDVEAIQHENEFAAVEIRKPTELLDAGAKAKLYKTLHQRYDNPVVLDLSASLFSENRKSLWSRPHSLVHQHGCSRKSSISAAIASFLKR